MYMTSNCGDPGSFSLQYRENRPESARAAQVGAGFLQHKGHDGTEESPSSGRARSARGEAVVSLVRHE